MKNFIKKYNNILEQISKINSIPCKYRSFNIMWNDDLNIDQILFNCNHHSEQRLNERSDYSRNILFDLIQKGLLSFSSDPNYANYRKDGADNNFTILSSSYPDIKIKLNIVKHINKRYQTHFDVYIITVLTKDMKDYCNDIPINVEDQQIMKNNQLNDQGYFVDTIPIYVD